MQTGIFEENKKSEEFKESSQVVCKTNIKVLNFTDEFVKEVKANFKKNVNFYNQSQANRDNPEKAKVGNKKKLLKIMAFRFMRKSNEEARNKEESDNKYQNDDYSSAAESSLYSQCKKLENNSNMKSNKKNNVNKNSNKSGKVDCDKNSNSNKDKNKDRDKENLNEPKAASQVIGIIDVNVENFFFNSEKRLNDLTIQQNHSNSRKQKDLNQVDYANPKPLQKQNDYNNNNRNYNNMNINNSKGYIQKNISNNNDPRNNNGLRTQNTNSNVNQNFYNNYYNNNNKKAYVNNAGYYYNSNATNQNQQVYFNGIQNSYNNNNLDYNYNQASQPVQSFNSYDSRGIQKGSYVSNPGYSNYQNFEEFNGNKKNKNFKGKKY